MPEGLRPLSLGEELAPDEAALLNLGKLLQSAGYRFVTITPESHRRVNARKAGQTARTLREVFGWSRPFASEDFPQDVIALMRAAGVAETRGNLTRSTVRFSTLGTDLFVHSSFPTGQQDAVFFGPDTYRFARLIERELALYRSPVKSLLDIGCGTGAGGLFAAQLFQPTRPERLVLADINPTALRFALVNAALCGRGGVECIESDVTATVEGSFDLILSNPPYMIDPAARAYRNGGGDLGANLSARILEEALPRLNPGGRLILYTGVAIVDGEDPFQALVKEAVANAGMRLRYEEIDPDVFGEELDSPVYHAVERIAVVAIVVDALT